MLIITLRTDKQDAEIGLYEDDKQLLYEKWYAHRELAETLHLKLVAVLKKNQHTLQDIEGIIVFKGPGSFTGLRIGLTVANALAYSLSVPIVAVEEPHWLEIGLQRLRKGETDIIAQPEYGALPHITPQKK